MDIVDRLSPRGFDCVCGNLRMAARAVTGVYDRHLAASGVLASQMAVLWAVAATPGVTIKQLAGRIAMHETTLIRNVRVLERQGWVSVQTGADRRQRIASLTVEGRAAFANALPLWVKAQAEVAGYFDESLKETNRKLLRMARAT